MKYVQVLLALGAIAAAGSASAANRPSGWTTICKESETCYGGCEHQCRIGPRRPVLLQSVERQLHLLVGHFRRQDRRWCERVFDRAGHRAAAAATADHLRRRADAADLGSYPGCEMPPNTQTVQLAATQVVAGRHGVRWSEQGLQPLGWRQMPKASRRCSSCRMAARSRTSSSDRSRPTAFTAVGNCTLNRVWWQDVGEDAATALGAGRHRDEHQLRCRVERQRQDVPVQRPRRAAHQQLLRCQCRQARAHLRRLHRQRWPAQDLRHQRDRT